MTIPLADRAVTRYRRSRPRRAGDRPPPRRMCGGLGGRDRRIIAVLAGETIGVFANFPFWALPDRDPLGGGRVESRRQTAEGSGWRRRGRPCRAGTRGAHGRSAPRWHALASPSSSPYSLPRVEPAVAPAGGERRHGRLRKRVTTDRASGSSVCHCSASRSWSISPSQFGQRSVGGVQLPVGLAKPASSGGGPRRLSTWSDDPFLSAAPLVRSGSAPHPVLPGGGQSTRKQAAARRSCACTGGPLCVG